MTGNNEIATQTGSTAVGHTAPDALYRAHHDESKNLRAGRIFLKYSKGDWMIGKDAEGFHDNTFHFVPAMDLFEKGWQCWSGGRPIDERFVPYGTPPILESTLPDHGPYAAKNDGWTEALKFPLMIVPGGKNTTAWLNVEFSASSAGGKNMIYSLSRQFSEKIKLGEITAQKSYVLCRAGSDHYMHREFGKVFYPTVEIIQALSMDEVQALLSKAVTTNAPTGDTPAVTSTPATPTTPDALDLAKVTVTVAPTGIVKPDGTPVQPAWVNAPDAADAVDVSVEEAEAELALAEAKAKLARAKAAKAKAAMSTSAPAVTVPPPEPTAPEPTPAKKTTNRRRATV
jgi:hypothetical protein